MTLWGSTALIRMAQADASYIQDFWSITCEMSRYTCEGIPLPNVVYVPFPSSLYGVYLGGNSLFLNNDLEPYEEDDILAQGVLIHEMIHYLQSKEDGQSSLINSNEEWCISEGEAYDMANRYFALHDAIEHFTNWERRCQ